MTLFKGLIIYAVTVIFAMIAGATKEHDKAGDE